MKTIKSLEVWMGTQKVGTLAETLDRKIAFEYDSSWLINGFSISPLSLPLEKGVFIAKAEPFEGLFGVFADSLPDGWGRLLVDRMLLRENINPYQITPLQRLAIVGNRMCFNIFSHNRDDHSKNFSFLYDTALHKWKLTPAYDMTYSNSIGGEHATCVDGNGANPGLKELVAVGVAAGISELKCRDIAEEIKNIVDTEL